MLLYQLLYQSLTYRWHSTSNFPSRKLVFGGSCGAIYTAVHLIVPMPHTHTHKATTCRKSLVHVQWPRATHQPTLRRRRPGGVYRIGVCFLFFSFSLHKHIISLAPRLLPAGDEDVIPNNVPYRVIPLPANPTCVCVCVARACVYVCVFCILRCLLCYLARGGFVAV